MRRRLAGLLDRGSPFRVQALGDMSNFPKMADRMLQGFLNFMMIQRAMIHPDGFADLPAFQLDPDGPGGEIRFR